MLFCDPIDILAAPGGLREMDPAEFLERRFGRVIVAIAIDRLFRRLAIGKMEAVVQRDKPGIAGVSDLTRETYEIVFRV